MAYMMIFDWLKTAPQYLIPKQALTVLAGFAAQITHQGFKNALIRQFIRAYQVNMSEALIEDPTQYRTFNDFFIRHLKPDVRPMAPAAIVSPVDGVVSEIGAIQKGSLIQAKGHQYSVQELLACSLERAAEYQDGQFATLYLSPKDYHRVHMPMDARLIGMTYVPGALFSVSPTTARTIPKLFARNERLVIYFDTAIGPMAMVMVGATIVGAIGTSWHGELKRQKTTLSFDYNQHPFQKGDEAGYFKLGSTVILLFANGSEMTWNKSLSSGSAIKLGQHLGDFTGAI